MALDKKVSFFLNKYLTRINSLYAPDEFARKKEQISIVNEAIKKGIRII
jgi:hypothetical protein